MKPFMLPESSLELEQPKPRDSIQNIKDETQERFQQQAFHDLSCLLKEQVLEESTVSHFRQQLTSAMERLLQAFRIDDTDSNNQALERFDADGIQGAVVSLDWDGICAKFDATGGNRTNNQNTSETRVLDSTPPPSNTLLDYLMECFRDATVWPPAVGAGLVQALLRVLLMSKSRQGTTPSLLVANCDSAGLGFSPQRSSRSDWKPSMVKLLDVILDWLQRQPSLHRGIDWTETYTLTITQTTNKVVKSVERAISITKQLVRSFPERSLQYLPLFLDILCAIEYMLLQLRQPVSEDMQKPLAKNDDTDNHHQSTTSTNIHHGTNVAVLHDEASDQEEEVYSRNLTRRWTNVHFSRFSKSASYNLNRVYQADTGKMWRKQTRVRIESLRTLRTRAMRYWMEASRAYLKGPVGHLPTLFQSVARALERQSTWGFPSPSGLITRHVRLCAVSFAMDWKAKEPQRALSWQCLWRAFWSQARRCSRRALGIHLSCYVELLVESAHYDQSGELNSAVAPLLNQLSRIAGLPTTFSGWAPSADMTAPTAATRELHRGTIVATDRAFTTPDATAAPPLTPPHTPDATIPRTPKAASTALMTPTTTKVEEPISEPDPKALRLMEGLHSLPPPPLLAGTHVSENQTMRSDKVSLPSSLPETQSASPTTVPQSPTLVSTDIDDQQTDRFVEVETRLLLQSLAFLLAHRGAILNRIPSFSGLLAQLSVQFPNPSHWVVPGTLSSSEESRLITALESSGAFGVVEDNDGSSACDDDKDLVGTENSADSWLFDPSSKATIRTRSMAFPDLFSSYSLTNTDPEISEYKTSGKPSLPLNMLSEDVLRTILSFMGYKRNLINRQVCRRWKKLADDDHNTWMPLYLSRFQVDPLDPAMKDTRRQAWKEMFIKRWQAEREIRFRRTRSGWKWRLCPHLGCLTVLRTLAQAQRHAATHAARKRKREAKPTGSNAVKKRRCTEQTHNLATK